jgi:uncharacterized protein YbcC (UPF0753/DUF2309 family)
MGVIEKLDAIKNTVPHYWPIGSFIHHNPLKGFEDMKFKDALERAKKSMVAVYIWNHRIISSFTKRGKSLMNF